MDSIVSKIFRIFVSVFLGLCLIKAHAFPQTSQWFSQGPNNNIILHVDLFLSSTCPHCHNADLYFYQIQSQYPWLSVNRYIINEDKAALKYFYQQLKAQHSTNFATPTIIFCNSKWTGWSDSHQTGKLIVEQMQYCRQSIIKHGKLLLPVVDSLRSKSLSEQVEMNDKIQSPVSFIALTALASLVTPCSLFLFSTFLALIWLYCGYKKRQFVLGITFIVSLGLIQFFHQAYLDNYLSFFKLAHWAVIPVGFCLFLYVLLFGMGLRRGFVYWNSSFLIPLTSFLTLGIYPFQQTCSTNMALVFEGWLERQILSPGQNAIYYLAYQVIYLMPLLLSLIVFIFIFSKFKMTTFKPVALLASLMILIVVSILLMFQPIVLNNMLASYALLLASMVVGWVMYQLRKDREL